MVYILTEMCILAKKCRIHRIPKDHKKFNKKEGASEDALIPLKMGNKLIT